MTGGERAAKANEPRCARERGLSGPPPYSPSTLLIYTLLRTGGGSAGSGSEGEKGVREGVHNYDYICHTASAALSQCNSLVFPPQQPPATWLFASLHRP